MTFSDVTAGEGRVISTETMQGTPRVRRRTQTQPTTNERVFLSRKVKELGLKFLFSPDIYQNSPAMARISTDLDFLNDALRNRTRLP